MKIEVTPAQLEAIKSMADDMSAMVGGGDEAVDKAWTKYVKAVDQMLVKNKLEPRNFN